MGGGDLDQDNVVVVGRGVVAIGGGGIEEGIGVEDGMDEGERGQEEIDTSPILKEGVKSLGDEGHSGPRRQRELPRRRSNTGRGRCGIGGGRQESREVAPATGRGALGTGRGTGKTGIWTRGPGLRNWPW